MAKSTTEHKRTLWNQKKKKKKLALFWFGRRVLVVNLHGKACKHQHHTHPAQRSKFMAEQ
eukprot:m.69019 g.69019  ORF g.69019 m.69019 type:complete len:60 (+) comp16747_c1_seq2:39-218(+)